jgi:succinate-semialdehyde dehydrogenase/glutarate-semialdehyde dehydrogenase
MTKKLISTNPAQNYTVIGEVETTPFDEITTKVTKAQKAKKIWKDLGVVGRNEYLKKIIENIENNKQQIANLQTQEMGMPISQSLQDVDSALHYFSSYLKEAPNYLAPEISYQDDQAIHQVFHEPLGVAAVITPWNFPISNFVWGVAQNLVAGNVVIFKHSEECPLFGKLMEQIVNESDLPEGVFTEIYGGGEEGDFLVRQNIDLIWFTGSTKVGKKLYQIGAEKFIKVVMELGGSSPGIILKDADIDRNLDAIFEDRFLNCGQVCDGLKRLIVHQSKYDEVVTKLTKKIQSTSMGDPTDSDVYFGPLVAERQLIALETQYQDALSKGAKTIIGGKRPENLQGAFFEPTLLTNITFDMKVWQEEVFGPILPIVTFETDDQAIKLANDTKYGLGSYVFTEDKEKAKFFANQIEAGMVGINSAYYGQPTSPFGGIKESGLGRDHGRFGFHDLTQLKVVATEK